MINKIKKAIEQQKTLIANFSYLAILNVFNMVLPLITYPYLIRVLGKETYGLVVFVQAIIAYLLIIVSFGFNISATKEVSIHRDNKEKLSEIVSSIMIIKCCLFLMTLVILYFSMYFIPQAKDYKLLFYLSMWICVYELLFPIWYFQGIEKMKYITYITLISRLIFLGLIFAFIHTENDYLYLPIINGIGAILAGVVSLYIIFVNHHISFKLQHISVLKFYVKESIPIFLSNVSIKLYVSTNKVLVGAFLGMSEVAYYDLAEKIVSVLKVPQVILGQALFPKINKDKDVIFVRKIFFISVGVNILIYIVLLFFADFFILFLGGTQMMPAKVVLFIMGSSIPIVAISNIFGIQLLVPFGFIKEFSKVIISSGIFYFIQLLILWNSFGFTIESISIITVTTELFVTCYMYFYCLKFELWKKNMITSS
ncbi:flippase [Flavobacterium sp. ALD4]|uniref:flippase n=1 Tax=Flavobacterium sp. ALD4 TaxID=2058314 RepID=UPI000C32373F|nr:flippase [Flavobacterium sp. ALD4]PKH67651.1 flippase [Flavobacterium sp. ALD4]